MSRIMPAIEGSIRRHAVLSYFALVFIISGGGILGVNGDPIEWFPEHHSCSEFLCVMAHWQAVMGGFGRTWSASVDANFPERLDGWGRVGAVNGMHAFNRSGVALCWLRWDDDWRIFAASADDGEVERLSGSLNVSWDPNYE
jgi:hypothetical protein